MKHKYFSVLYLKSVVNMHSNFTMAKESYFILLMSYVTSNSQSHDRTAYHWKIYNEKKRRKKEKKKKKKRKKKKRKKSC